jgi:putative tryptophan/tyrosine transport system substrate-binding protein
MRRRNLIGGGAALAAFAPRAWAQQPERLRQIGALIAFAENDPRTRAMVAAFAQALEHLGWVAGRNIRIDYRFAAGDQARFKTYAAELVSLAPDAVLASTPPAVAALQQQTRTIPIIFVLVVDPVEQGFVQSLARPGGNITGFSSHDASLMGKWLGLLKEVAPRVTRVGIIFNPDTAPNAGFLNTAIEAAAPVLGVTLTLDPVRDDAGIDTAVAAQAREPGGGLVCLPNPFNDAHRERIIAAALRHGLPLIATSSFPEAGGLMSYWFDPIDLHAQAASYVDRILRGANPADLPVQQPTKFELVINLRTAKALGLTVPQSILARADEVIE